MTQEREPVCWTLASLKSLMDERDRRYEEHFVAVEKSMAASQDSAKEARDEYRRNTDKWQAGANEWRQAMTDKDRGFVTKASLWGYLIGAIATVLALLEMIDRLRHAP